MLSSTSMNKLRFIFGWGMLAICCCFSTVWGQANDLQVTEARLPTFIPGSPIFINTVEGEIQLGRGGGATGFMVKANDWRIAYRPGILYWGGSLSSFWGSEKWDAPPATITGNIWDTHFRLHLGNSFYRIFHSRFNLNFELYGGGFFTSTKGIYTQSNLGFTREFSNREWVWDGGGRFAIQCHLKNGWGIQTSVTSSWKQAGFGLGVPAGLFASETDGKTAIGIGVYRSWGWDSNKPKKKGHKEALDQL